MNLDTSPLTRLPGGTTIGQVMEKRIEAEMDIAFCLMDIDNFKAYNDNYGYAKGNEVIQSAADVITQAVADYGCEEDFIGHIGGDDYVVITTPDKCEKICQAVTEYFDKAIPGFYNSKDRKRGYIEGENRQGDEMLFPLASISIAVVTNYEKKLTNHIEFGEAAAELKEEAKSMTGSVYVVDQRKKEDGSKKDRSVIKLKKTKPKRKKKGAAK
jgi:diguanylate cyclase (GGDEF)-like protein